MCYAGSGKDGEDDYQGHPDMDDERWTTSYWTQYTVLLSRAARVKRFQAFATKVCFLLCRQPLAVAAGQ